MQRKSHPPLVHLEELLTYRISSLYSLLSAGTAKELSAPLAFPQTIILCGVRDVRDYRIHTAHHEIITGGSAFNIKAESLRLGIAADTPHRARYRKLQR